MSTQPICKRCGRPIVGNYLNALGTSWHPEHFLCAGCGQPVNSTSFFLHQDQPYHEECYKRLIAPHCAYCGRALIDEYLVDYWGTMFCKEHQQQYPKCDFCGRLVLPRDQEAGAESVRCPVCRKTGIETAAEARPIFQGVKQWVGSQGLRYNNLPLSLELCNRAKLAHYLRAHGTTHSLGATMTLTHTMGGKVTNTEISGVAVLQGLPALLFKGVVIHELGHVWLVVHNVQLPVWGEEGFCELLSYRFYKEQNTIEHRYHAEAIERNHDPIYGDGFRRVRAIEHAMGFQRFLETLEKTKRLPA